LPIFGKKGRNFDEVFRSAIEIYRTANIIKGVAENEAFVEQTKELLRI